jgi:hypothetical protein
VIAREYLCRGALVMFRAFVDDTGSDPREFAFTFAAWVGHAEEWDRFSDEWLEELQREPAIRYFRHYEAKSRTGQFSGWQRSDCGRKILRLAEVIARHELYGAVTGIKNQAVSGSARKAVVSAKTLRSILHASRTYDFCFHSIVSLVLQYQVELGETDRVDFVFDQGDSAFDDCSEMFRGYKNEPAYRQDRRAILGTITVSDDKVVKPLQAADLLAGESTAKLRGQLPGEPFKLLARRKKILFCPIKSSDPMLANFENVISYLNIVWSTRLLDLARKQDEEPMT